MQGIKRKLVYVSLFEVFGMTFSALGLALLSGTSPSSTGPLAVVITSIAVTWNFIYTSLFERWESRQVSRTRTVKRRIAHAVGFQLTLILFIPCYTFVFNWLFDRVFGLPASALPDPA